VTWSNDQICGIMSLPSPLSRYYRDDITVSVIFLGDLKKEGTKEGGVFVNEEASGPNLKTIKAKL
jgi:pyruvate dehydrogenase phosphatase